MGRTIDIRTDDGTAEAYLTGEGPGVLFFIDAIGLRPRIEEMADRIAGWGFTVLAPNIHFRHGTAAELRPTTDLTDPENRKAFGEVTAPRVSGYTTEQSDADTRHWVEELRRHAAPGPIGVTGYCMGARLAVRAAALFPDDVVAVGGFHGAKLVDDTAESAHLLLPRCRAEFVFGHADHDQLNDAEAIAELERALDDAGLRAVSEVYPDAPHGYSMSDTSSYQEEGAERMFEALELLLDRTLRGARP